MQPGLLFWQMQLLPLRCRITSEFCGYNSALLVFPSLPLRVLLSIVWNRQVCADVLAVFPHDQADAPPPT